MKKLLLTLLLAFLPVITFAQLNVNQGGTGKTSFPINALVGVDANGFQRMTATGTPQLTIGNLLSTTTATSTFAGSVGVGTTTPWATFSINPTAGKASARFAVGSTTETNLLVNNSGNVVIDGQGNVTGQSDLSVTGRTQSNLGYWGNSAQTIFFGDASASGCPELWNGATVLQGCAAGINALVTVSLTDGIDGDVEIGADSQNPTVSIWQTGVNYPGVSCTGDVIDSVNGIVTGCASSDSRLKTATSTLGDITSYLDDITVYSFKWNSTYLSLFPNAPTTTQYGLMAQELLAHPTLKQFVSTNIFKIGGVVHEYYGIQYQRLIPPMLQILKNLKTRLDTLASFFNTSGGTTTLQDLDCVSLNDRDGSGVTWITVNNGQVFATSTKPAVCNQ